MSEATQALPSELTKAHELIEQLRGAVCEKDELIAQLLHQLQCLRRHQYGRKSEQLNELQGELFAALEALRATEQPPEVLPAHERPAKRAKPSRQPLPEPLPRQRVEYQLPKGMCACELCGHTLTKIGEELTEQLEYVPASLYVVAHTRFKYACKHCHGQVVTVSMPPQPIEKGIPGPGLLAHVLTSKYADHQPLNRQRGILQRHGVVLPRTTLVDWVRQSAGLLKPLVDELHQVLLGAAKIHTDDTTVPVLEKGRKKTRQGRLWVYLSEGEYRCTVYDYTATRSRDGPKRMLAGFEGYLQADAYAGYDELYEKGDISEVACWAHARRKYFDAQNSDAANARIALQYIGALYEIEREAKRLEPEERRALRQARSMPILAQFRAWLDETVRVVLPKSPMGQAIQYTFNQWAALQRYTEDGRLAIDNNAAERAMRPLVVGRRNWTFAGSNAGGERAATIYSLIATAKQHDIDPYAYLADILKRLPSTLARDIDTLLPWNWAPANP